MENYYSKQLTSLNPIHTLKIQVRDDNNKTNWMDLNRECIAELEVFLKTYKMTLPPTKEMLEFAELIKNI